MSLVVRYDDWTVWAADAAMNWRRRLLGALLVVVALALPGCTLPRPAMQRMTTAITATVPPSSPTSWAIIAVQTSTPESKSGPTAVVTAAPTAVEPTPEPAPTSTQILAEPEPEPTATTTPVLAVHDPKTSLPTQPLEHATCEVTAAALNVRQGPGTGFAVIGVVRRGHQFAILDANPAGTWLHVCCVEGKEGWVIANEVRLSSPEDATSEGGAEPEPATGPSPPEPSASPPPTPAASSSLMRIAIPDLAIDAPVVKVGWVEVEVDGQRQVQWEVADFAAGYHAGSALPGQAGNVVISGHHNIKGRVFKNISLAWNQAYAELQADGITWRSNELDGRSIYLHNAEGQRFQYVIEGLYKVPDRNVSEEQRKENARFMAPTAEPTLTLITCWPYTDNSHRIVVVAKLVQ